jgi:hypothetical protein
MYAFLVFPPFKVMVDSVEANVVVSPAAADVGEKDHNMLPVG